MIIGRRRLERLKQCNVTLVCVPQAHVLDMTKAQGDADTALPPLPPLKYLPPPPLCGALALRRSGPGPSPVPPPADVGFNRASWYAYFSFHPVDPLRRQGLERHKGAEADEARGDIQYQRAIGF